MNHQSTKRPTRCSVPGCRNEPVARCTNEVLWYVCLRHYISAGGNGFLPKLFGQAVPLTPEEAVRLWRDNQTVRESHDT